MNHELSRVDLKTKGLSDGRSYLDINPKGYVPALELPDGEVLTESAAILQYIGDLNPLSKLVPENGSLERYQLQAWLNFLGAEIHKRAGLLVNTSTPVEMQRIVRPQIDARLDWLNGCVAGKDGLMGEDFTVADAHLFFLLHGFERLMRFSLDKWPDLSRLFNSTLKRASVRTALEREGLLVTEMAGVAN